MLIDTHCHINLMVKKSFESALTSQECQSAQLIVDQAFSEDVKLLVCVGTNLIESNNCIELARAYQPVFASIGTHPNDATEQWNNDISHYKKLLKSKESNKIIAIGECGIDRHYEGYQLQRQKDVFKAHIELALEHDLALIVHSRDASEETLYALDEFSKENLRGTMHCFSYDTVVAQDAIKRGFLLGIGGTITYPKNDMLRTVVKAVGISNIILETDSPYLPPQIIRGKANTPSHIKAIAQYVGELLDLPADEIALTTTGNAKNLFRLE